jgi:hypothetical protein
VRGSVRFCTRPAAGRVSCLADGTPKNRQRTQTSGCRGGAPRRSVPRAGISRFGGHVDSRPVDPRIHGFLPHGCSPAWRGSVQIRGDGAWELCDTPGNCATIDQDVSDLSDLRLNDRITSARVVNNSRYR